MKLIIIIGILLIFGPAKASVLTVCPSGCEYNSIQTALDMATPGDTVEVHSGTYEEKVNVNKAITIKEIDTGQGRPLVRYMIHADDVNIFSVPNPDINASNPAIKAASKGLKNPELIRVNGDANKSGEGEHSKECWAAKGDEFYDQGKYEDAIRAYDEAIRMDPQFAAAWNNKGVALDELGKYVDAVHCCAQAIRINPEVPEAWNNNGVALDDLKEYDDAIECFDKAIEINPQYAKAWNNKGFVLQNQGKHEAALECFNKAIELDSSYAAPRENKGKSLSALGRSD